MCWGDGGGGGSSGCYTPEWFVFSLLVSLAGRVLLVMLATDSYCSYFFSSYLQANLAAVLSTIGLESLILLHTCKISWALCGKSDNLLRRERYWSGSNYILYTVSSTFKKRKEKIHSISSMREVNAVVSISCLLDFPCLLCLQIRSDRRFREWH